MHRSSPSLPGRALLVLPLTALVVLAFFDLSSPTSHLHSLWDSVFQGRAPGEGMRDDMVDRLGIPR
jgi:hypothetical protein